jgi:hypothetical protein
MFMRFLMTADGNLLQVKSAAAENAPSPITEALSFHKRTQTANRCEMKRQPRDEVWQTSALGLCRPDMEHKIGGDLERNYGRAPFYFCCFIVFIYFSFFLSNFEGHLSCRTPWRTNAAGRLFMKIRILVLI